MMTVGSLVVFCCFAVVIAALLRGGSPFVAYGTTRPMVEIHLFVGVRLGY